MKIAVIHCHDCHDFALFVDGVRVKDVNPVAEFTLQGHTAQRAEWEI